MATSDKILLNKFLTQIKTGHTQLPDFQRDWKWHDENIKKLLVSVSLSYPIGAVMVLQTGNNTVPFNTRFIEGVEIDQRLEADWLVLDGQQRLTALYQSLMSNKPVSTKSKSKNAKEYWYYFDMEKSLIANDGSQRDEAIISISNDKKYTSENQQIDINNSETEYQNCLFPLNKIFDVQQWRRGYEKYWSSKEDQNKIELYDKFEQEIIKQFIAYEVPYILLPKETPMKAVCQVFVRVNKGNEQLTTFDLLTAKFAVDSFNLREDWNKKEEKLKLNKKKKNHVFHELSEMQFLQTTFLLTNIQKGDTPIFDSSQMLENLTLEDYQKYSQEIVKSFKEIEKFLHKLKIFSSNELPYITQLVPLAVVMAKLDIKEFQRAGVHNKLERWFLCGVISQRYGRKPYNAILTDIKQLPDWLLQKNNLEPDTIIYATFPARQLRKLKRKDNAVYKGLCSLIMEQGCKDFLTGDTIDQQKYFEDNIDMHHIFPQAWCKKNSMDSDRCNSIINKTPISAMTNRKIGAKSPSEYLRMLMEESHLSKDQINDILRTHLIDPETLWNDDFDSFFQAREKMLLEKIENKTGNKIIRSDDYIDQNDQLDDDNDNEQLNDW
jgi:hypothetical protein